MTNDTPSASIQEEVLKLLSSPTPERIVDHFNKASDVRQVHSMFRALSDVIQ